MSSKADALFLFGKLCWNRWQTGILPRLRLRQVLYPLVFVKVRDDPGDLAYLVHAGAGVYEGYWPFEMGAQKGKRNGDQPHAYDQGIGVEDDVATAVKDAVYDDGER